MTSLATGGAGRGPTALGAYRYLADRPELAQAAAAEQRLAGAADGDGFRALSVRRTLTVSAAHRLAARFGAEPLNVAAVFLAALHEQVDPRPLPTWETVLAADAAPPGTRAARKISEYVEAAWAAARPRLLAAIRRDPAAGAGPARPLLLVDAGPFGRYRGLDVLYAMAELARSGQRPTWVLCPAADPGEQPRLDGALVEVQTENEWIRLPDAWVRGEHRDAIGDLGA
ncbi:hypothetical protein [Candidatus Frankia alpina]|uniref:hypothetical protein n=1 Tax=Candidatus Frankia alpina TaxID=2699483 RepID=UPI0013D4DCA6|nr:hypothetical protein [Candidatus Frankia alpina]